MEQAEIAFAREVGQGLNGAEIPAYALMLDAYQRAHAAELRAMIADLPLQEGDRVLDLACGAGAYSRLLAERVWPGGLVIGLDIAPAYLALAQQRSSHHGEANLVFQQGDSAALPFDVQSFDLVWCAQSMYSLPDPLATLREMRRVTRWGGVVAVFENDTLHQVVLPWPPEIEIAVRAAQLRALSDSSTDAERFFIGRDLCAAFAAAGLEGCSIRPYVSVRHAPLAADEQTYLRWYLSDLAERALPYLDARTRAQFERLIDPESKEYLLHQPDFFVTYIGLVAQATVS